MYKIKDLTNQNLNKDLIGKFVDFVVKKLQINEPFSVYFVDDKENGEKELGKTAMYNPETKSVYIYATNRHPKDMMRSCAHELMHHKQNIAGELGEITPDEAERQANEAGYILRQFEDDMKKKFLLEEGVKIVLREGPVSASTRTASRAGPGDQRVAYNAARQYAIQVPAPPDWVLNKCDKMKRPGDAERCRWNTTKAWPTLPAHKRMRALGFPLGNRSGGTRGSYGYYSKCLDHQRKNKRDGRCYPKGFDTNKSFLTPVSQWTLMDIVNARKDLYRNINGKIYNVFDVENRRSVFREVRNKAIRTLILDKNLFPKIYTSLFRFRQAQKPAKDYMKKYNKKLNDPESICTMYEFKKYFGQKLSKADKAYAERNCKDALGARTPSSRISPRGGWNRGWRPTAPEGGFKLKEQTKEQYVDQGPPMPRETVPSKMVPAPWMVPGPDTLYDKKGRPVTFVPEKASKFQIYGQAVLDASYMIYKLNKDGELRIGVKSGGQPLTIPKPLINDFLKFAINPANQETVKDVVAKANGIYGVVPLTRKSDRAIDDEDKRRRDNVHMTLAILGAVPLPWMWTFDALLAGVFFEEWWKNNQGKNVFDARYLSDPAFQNMLLTAGFAIGFTKWATDAKKANRWLRTIVDSERKMYMGAELITGAQGYNKVLARASSAAERAKKAAGIVDGVIDDTANLVGSKAHDMGWYYKKLLGDLEKAQAKIVGSAREKKAIVDKYIQIRIEVKRRLNQNVKVSEIMTDIRRAEVHTLAPPGYRSSTGAWVARTEQGVVDALREELKVLNRNFVEQNIDILRKGGAYGIKHTDDVAKISEKLADDVIAQLKQDKGLYRRVIRRSEGVTTHAAIEVEDRIVSELAGGNPEVLKVLREGLDPKNTTSAKDIAETMFKVSGWSDEAVALEKTKGFVFGRTKGSLQNKAMKDFVEEQAKHLDVYFGDRARLAIKAGAGPSRLRRVKAIWGRAASEEFFFGTAVTRRAVEMYLTGNRGAMAASGKVGQAVGTLVARLFKGKDALPGPMIAGFTKWVIRFVIFKVHWPIVAYLRYYRPYCGWTLEEFTEHVATEALTFTGILNPININWAEVTVDPIFKALEKTKETRCKRGSEFKNSLDLQGMAEWEKDRQRTIIEMNAWRVKAQNWVISNPEVIRLQNELQKEMEAGAKKLLALKKQAEIAYEKCKKDPKAKNCEKVRNDILKGLTQKTKEIKEAAEKKTGDLAEKITNNVSDEPELKRQFEDAKNKGIDALDAGSKIAKEALIRAEKSELGKKAASEVEELKKAAKALGLPVDPNIPPGGGPEVIFKSQDESKNLSLGDVLKEYKEKELNDKFKKLVKGMTE